MTDRPITFNAPMVRALLEGRKTQTRRVLKPHLGGPWMGFGYPRVLDDTPVKHRPGDRLYVREAHAILPRTAYRCSIGTGTIDQREHPSDGYSAAVFREGFDRSGAPRWRPSIHMPRWASRLTLIVTDVRVQRLNELTDADAIAEGINVTGDCSPSVTYAKVWDDLNKKRGFSWQSNPWVVALAFRTELKSGQSYQ